jgi:hypothetical protein
MVQNVLLLILGSRYGATEKAILIITQGIFFALFCFVYLLTYCLLASPAIVSPLLSAMKRMLIVYMANLNFSHPYLRQAVELKYPLSIKQ